MDEIYISSQQHANEEVQVDRIYRAIAVDVAGDRGDSGRDCEGAAVGGAVLESLVARDHADSNVGNAAAAGQLPVVARGRGRQVAYDRVPCASAVVGCL